MENPEPLTPAEADLQGYGFMPFYGHRLFGSDFNARCNDAEWRAGVTLWWAAWNQVPAGSLPDDDTALARLADLGRDVRSWKKLREHALHGFVKCSDGRLYHKALAPLVIEAWDRRIAERERKRKWREKKQEQNADVPSPETGTRPGRDADVPAERKGEGQDRREEIKKLIQDSIPRAPRASRANFADPAVRKQAWEQKISQDIIEGFGPEEGMHWIERYQAGDPDAKKLFNEISNARKTGTA